ncbi:hypothetical protein M422DRAFT_275517, partial [Sphaerobolus stellatus SS14]
RKGASSNWLIEQTSSPNAQKTNSETGPSKAIQPPTAQKRNREASIVEDEEGTISSDSQMTKKSRKEKERANA